MTGWMVLHEIVFNEKSRILKRQFCSKKGAKEVFDSRTTDEGQRGWVILNGFQDLVL